MAPVPVWPPYASDCVVRKHKAGTPRLMVIQGGKSERPQDGSVLRLVRNVIKRADERVMIVASAVVALAVTGWMAW